MTRFSQTSFHRGLALFALGLGLAVSLRASDAPTKVDVVFDHPENFRDVRDSSMNTERSRETILARLKEYIEEQATKLVPDGQKFTITFTDIDLAGDFEPWRGPQWADIRVVKDIYPPRIYFTYKLEDAAGTVLNTGKADLVDLNCSSRMVMDRSDSLRLEKDMLRDWLRDYFRKR